MTYKDLFDAQHEYCTTEDYPGTAIRSHAFIAGAKWLLKRLATIPLDEAIGEVAELYEEIKQEEELTKFGWVKESNADARKPIVERVYSEDDLCASTVYSCWGVTDISDDKKLVDKVLERLRASYNFKVYICRDAVVFSCDNEQRGKIKCVFNLSYTYFTFGIVKCAERYDINKPLREYPKLKKFLEDMFGEHISDYQESKNI